jgi:CubicO group peptidase (beta-lactamase class C family)
MNRLVGLALTLVLLCTSLQSYCQSTIHYADSIRKAYAIPELAYAVVSAGKVIEMQALGYRKINTQMKAGLNDRFRIGSNTKAITGFIAALLVKEGKIQWDTKFFDLYPELKTTSRKEYHHLTLLNLLSFRTKLFPYTYTNVEPTKEQFTGNADAQRYQFTKWFFAHEPAQTSNEINFSNLGYVAAGLMLEKASGKTYKQLVSELGKTLNIEFGYGWPNATDHKQTWGHNASLQPEATAADYKLDWLLPAGNINITLPDYIKFIQEQLKGLQGKSALLTKQEFEFLHYGLPGFAVGWNWTINDKLHKYSYHAGNPGTFLSKVFVYSEQGKAIIVLANVQSDRADEGMSMLAATLRNTYIK